jgi:hypothetical protein
MHEQQRPAPPVQRERDQDVRVTLHLLPSCCGRPVVLRVDGSIAGDGSTVIDGTKAASALALHMRYCPE